MTTFPSLLKAKLEAFDKKFLFQSKVEGDPVMEYVNTPNIIQDTIELKLFLSLSLREFFVAGVKAVELEKKKPQKQDSEITEAENFGYNCAISDLQTLKQSLVEGKE